MQKKEKILQLIKSSKKVFQDCSLPNGAIIAANNDLPYYPKRAANYHFVWPRDASFICVAAQKVDLKIQKPFFKWLEDRPERFKKESLLFQRYSPNGLLEDGNFQPDQAATAIWAIYEYYKKDLSKALKFKKLILRLADGLANDWQGEFFFHHTVDLWEEGQRHTSSVYKNNHTYSLAACACGLELANKIIPNEIWQKKSHEMKKRIDFAYDQRAGRFLRNKGDKTADWTVDASLIGLVWPFKIIKQDDQCFSNTIKKIEQEIVILGGVHRYENDMYDGEGSGQEGGGAWPILNFWLSIYWCLAGDTKHAEEYFNWVLDKLDEDKYGEFIPEQIFEDDLRRGVYPLAWSHAMFIFAVEKLYPELLIKK
ncbi:MAG: glycoside hydrolase family 15 protein [Patescibacteria group bacterium]